MLKSVAEPAGCSKMLGKVVFRKYKSSDYDQVSKIFVEGMWEAVKHARRWYYMNGSPIVLSMEIFSLAVGWLLGGSLTIGLLSVILYIAFGILMQYYSQSLYIR